MTPAPDRRTGRPPKRAYQPKPAGETKTPARLPEEVEGLVEMVAEWLRENYIAMLDLPADAKRSIPKWEHIGTGQQMWKESARQLLTRIVEHLGGRDD